MIIDGVLLLLVLLGSYKGYKRGLIVGVFSFVAIIAGAAAAVKLSSVAADYMKKHTDAFGAWLPFASFLLVFVGVVLLVRLAANALEEAVKVVALGGVNKAGGVVLYVSLLMVVYSIFLYYCQVLGFLSQSLLRESVTYHWLGRLGTWIVRTLAQ